MPLIQESQYLSLTRNSFYIIFPANGVVSYREFISCPSYVRFKWICWLSVLALLNTDNKLNNLNVNYFKIPKKHREPHKMPSRAACLRPLSQTLFINNSILSRYIWLLRLKLHCNVNDNHVERYRFHQRFHINFAMRKKAWVKQ